MGEVVKMPHRFLPTVPIPGKGLFGNGRIERQSSSPNVTTGAARAEGTIGATTCLEIDMVTIRCGV